MAKCVVKSLLAATATSLMTIAAYATGPTFRADSAFSGSTLTGFHTVGAAEWKAQNGEIIGTPKSEKGGWLVLDKSFQNVAVYANMQCASGCKTGFLMRMEKTADGGTKGVFFSVADGDIASYAIKLDAQGNEVSRTKLGIPGTTEGAPRGTNGVNTARPATYVDELAGTGINLPPLAKPQGKYKATDWNETEIILHNEQLVPSFNAGGLRVGEGYEARGEPKPADGKYGPIAIYIGGKGEVRLKDFRYKNLNKLIKDPEYLAPDYKMNRLEEFYYSWSTAVADFNHDGKQDIIAGPYLYLGPDFKTRLEIYNPTSFNPTSQYPIPSMVSLAYDFTGDGWPDILIMSGNAGNGTGTLYVNPKGEDRYWDMHVVIPHIGNEETLMKDIDGDGKPEIIHAMAGQLVYTKYDEANPTGPWGVNIGHGLGVGDINGDGRMDFINCYGWWEQPAPGSTEKTWVHHPEAFGRWGASQGGAGGAELAVYDINGDGLMDVAGPMEGHGYGLAWWEQKRDGAKISFVQHIIMDNLLTKNAGDVFFSEPHAAAFADINGDGLLDMITGKRYMSHFGYTDPDPFGPAVLYVYKLVRNPKAPGGAEFVPELIHNRSGVGSHMVVTDVNDDGRPDIVTAGVDGAFVFFNNEKQLKTKK